MRVVTDGNCHYVLQRIVDDDCHVRTLPSGETTTMPTASLSPADTDAALGTVDDNLVDDVGSNAAAGLLLELVVDGPTSARGLLDRFDVCESDLHGTVAELRAAGLIEPTTVYGERGYRAIIDGSQRLESL
jgi:hypothetical protein